MNFFRKKVYPIVLSPRKGLDLNRDRNNQDVWDNDFDANSYEGYYIVIRGRKDIKLEKIKSDPEHCYQSYLGSFDRRETVKVTDYSPTLLKTIEEVAYWNSWNKASMELGEYVEIDHKGATKEIQEALDRWNKPVNWMLDNVLSISHQKFND